MKLPWRGRRSRSASSLSPLPEGSGGGRRFFSRRAVPEGIRITTVGLWYVLLTVLVAIAATNTGNNALYMVLALMFSVLILSGVASRENVRGLEAALEPPGEVFANRPFTIGFTLRSRAARLPALVPAVHRLALGAAAAHPLPAAPGQEHRPARDDGRHARLPPLPVRSRVEPLPLRLLPQGVRYRVDFEVLVFPELFPAGGSSSPRKSSTSATIPAAARGWGHDLYSLRRFRRGDDPRGIHWKQTARTGELIFTERATERSRRLSIVFDNAVGELDGRRPS